jgi:uncharacterized protein (DUF2236 family)
MASKERELLKAQALRDTKTADRINSELSDEEREHYFLMTMALFAGALEVRLGETPTREQIDEFVNEMRYDYRDANPKMNFLAVEALIRALYGEEELADDISAADQYRVQVSTIVKIVAQSVQMQAQLEDYLSEAETLAAQWKSEA